MLYRLGVQPFLAPAHTCSSQTYIGIKFFVSKYVPIFVLGPTSLAIYHVVYGLVSMNHNFLKFDAWYHFPSYVLDLTSWLFLFSLLQINNFSSFIWHLPTESYLLQQCFLISEKEFALRGQKSSYCIMSIKLL